MEHYSGPITPNRFIPPLDLRHRDQPPNRQFQKKKQSPFEEMMIEELEEESELPQDIREEINRLKSPHPLALPQVSIITGNLNQYAIKLLREMEESTVGDAERPEGLDRLMGELITALGIALTEYGSSESLRGIAGIWKALDKNDNSYQKIQSLFQLTAMQKIIPLSKYQKLLERTNFDRKKVTHAKSVAIKAQLYEILKHEFQPSQVQVILSNFNFGVDPYS